MASGGGGYSVAALSITIVKWMQHQVRYEGVNVNSGRPQRAERVGRGACERERESGGEGESCCPANKSVQPIASSIPNIIMYSRLLHAAPSAAASSLYYYNIILPLLSSCLSSQIGLFLYLFLIRRTSFVTNPLLFHVVFCFPIDILYLGLGNSRSPEQRTLPQDSGPLIIYI